MLRRLLDSPWTYFALAGVLLAVLLITQLRFSPRPSGTADQIRALAERDDLNVVFIVIDTLRADRLHAYGYPRETSPALDYLANTGIRFDRVVSQSSWTKTSMASLWTATWPRRNGILRWSHSLPETATLPAELFQQAGFYTAGIWRNGWVAPVFGFQQGFQTYVRPKPRRTPAQFQKRTPSASALVGTDEDLTMAALEFLGAYGHQRFFLYVHYMDVHQYAYDQQSAKFGTSYSDVYDNAIHWVDRNVGTVIRALQQRDLQRKTLIAVASDHGEGFREHGLEGHARTLYREVAEVPFIIALPFELRPGIVVPDVVANVDVLPTILDLTGLPPLPSADGVSLVPLIEAAARGESGGLDRPLYAELDRTWARPNADADPLIAITRGNLRAFKALQPGKESEVELFDHAKDPWEKDNLVDGADGLPPALASELDAYLAANSVTWGAAEEVELEELELRQLRALGYAIE